MHWEELPSSADASRMFLGRGSRRRGQLSTGVLSVCRSLFSRLSFCYSVNPPRVRSRDLSLSPRLSPSPLLSPAPFSLSLRRACSFWSYVSPPLFRLLRPFSAAAVLVVSLSLRVSGVRGMQK
ncbi:hypothetical protein TGGT1_462966 [Toxoplasma gondii GT1]|uniref:Uncharacterized protein n=1 Tax=Toxoplasma gondii (strain ATCC 50853 / GT1) TaxID=507601 RepID=S7UTD0_TOXGG|nr:hypothetical protein TGGT1_462966 [Toxoplasma gondii GT1]